MRSRRVLLACLAALAVAAPGSAAAARPAHKHHRTTHRHAAARSRLRPHAFASCRALVGYARQHFAATAGRPDPEVAPVTVPTLAPVALGSNGQTTVAPSAAAANGSASSSSPTPEFSTTNDQEQGVDEPDVAKTDGSTIFYVSGRTLFDVAVSGSAVRLAGSLDLGPGGYGSQLLLSGHRLIVISHGALLPGPILATPPGAPGAPVATIAPSPYYYRGQTVVQEVDVSNPASPHVTRSMTVDGSFVDARQNGSTARLVIASAPLAIADAAARSRPGGWIPTRSFHSFLTGRHYVRPVAGCASVDRPAQFSGLGMLTILTLNLDKGLWTAGSDALMADAQVVYGSLGSLYVATQKWVDPQLSVQQLPAQTTVIEQLDASNPDTTTFAAAGEVPGYLLNQFSLSEFGGYLRVATTSRPTWWTGAAAPAALPQGLSQSYVTVLQRQGTQLTQVGQVGGLGRGQQIYSVRFVGDTGYVVTFHQVDPLYVIDLATPTAPAVTGQLELQGYSSYLHPLGNGLLLGIGQDVGSTNEPSGSQLELFDVSNPRAPALLAHATLGVGSSSPAQYDHHAFLYWTPRSLAVLPVELWPPPSSSPPPGQPTPAQSSSSQSTDRPFLGAIGFHVDRSGIAEVGRVSHPSSNNTLWPIERSIVIGGSLFTLSQDGVMSSSLDGLAAQSFAAFPTPAPMPVQPLAAASASG